ncbi:hypothetical protein GFL21_01905 [Rhizobium anhuiense]|nr:hypothetical protein [Rhizobium anhuiense]
MSKHAPPNASADRLHNSFNRHRFKDKIMQQFEVLQRPLRVWKGARRCRATIFRRSVPALPQCF